MLIKKLPARKISPLPPFLRRLVVKIFEAKENELPEILRKFVDVSLPKSDLNNWIGILNKFDRLLEDLIAKYELTSIQKTDFSLQDKELILAILALTKSLFDKCTNRNLYCSYERLNDLLNTNDLDVLEMVLSVIMRPAQRVNAQRSVRVNFLISQDRVSTLASNWGLSDPNITLKELASPAKTIQQESFPINFQFYGKAEAKASSKDKGSSKSSSSSKKEKSSEGATTDSPQVSILVNDPFSKGATSSEIFYKLVEEFSVPEDQWYPLFQKIRISTAVSNPLQRIKLLSVRLLALSVFCYVASETVVTRSVFVYEPNLILTLAGLLHPECDAPISIQTATLHSLDSISHFSTKLSEVLAAVGASTNHGVLLCMLKKVIASETADGSGFLLLVDALFSLLSYIFTSQSGGNMLVTAGIVSLLVQFIGGDMVQAPVRLRYKGIQLMDNAIYGFPTAFSSFQASNGLTTLVQRIDEQVDLCMRLEAEANAGEMEGILLIENLILLKGLVKFVLHMMQTSSTGVGLRNLIDSRLPASLKKIFEQPGLFSPMVYGQAVNVMSTIIHNEPTSLSILQEQELPQAFLKTAVAGFPAAAESLYPISNAFGAICLNTPGLELFTELGTLDQFFDIFISPEHVYVLEEPEVLTLLGGSFDELTRHHPALKAPVIQNIVRIIRELLKLGGDGFSAWAAEMAPYMERNNEESLAKHLRSAIDDATDKPEYGSVQLDEQPDQFLIRFIDAICKFLDGFFQSSSHFDTFQAQGGYEALLEIYSLPALPVDFPSLPAAANLVQVFRSANEGSVGPIITAVMNRLCVTLDQCKPWLDHVGDGSTIVQWLRGEMPDHTEHISEFHHHGRALHGLTDLLSDFSDPSLFTQGNVGAALLQAVLSAGFGRILPRLGHVLRTTQWECILMQSEQLVTELDGGSLSYVDPTVKSVYNVLAQANSHLTSFFQGLVKVSMTRRIMARPLKQDARAVLLEVATELRDYFGFDRVTTEPTVASLKYHATGLAFLTLQLLDRRHQMFIHLLMLMAFEKVGGFETFFACMDNSWQMFESKRCSDPQLERSLKKNIEIGLVLMEHLSSHRYYADCPYLPNILPGSTPEESVDPAYPSDYLSKYRHRTARFLASLWTSPAVSRLQKSHVRSMAIATGYIVKSQALRHDATHRPRAAGAHGGALSGLFSLRRPGPDQEQIQQLVDMGFPRDASESALTRFGNNMSRAAEYLLTHPEVVAAASFHSPQPPAEENSVQEDANDEPPSDMGASEEDDSDVLFFKADIHEIPSSEESEAMRAHLRSNLLLPVFQVLDNVEETVHFLRDLVVMLVKTSEGSSQVSDQFRSEITTCLDDPAAHGIPLARRLRLLGFLLIDEVVVRSMLGLATELFDPLVSLVSQVPVFPPVYLSTALVVIEVVLMYSDEPNLDELQPGVTLAPNLVTVDTPLLGSKVVLTSHRDTLTQTCLALLGHVAARDSDVLIAVVRLLMRLTREPDHARSFVEGGGVEALLTPMRTDLNRYMGQHVHVVIILRHLIETRAVLLEGFEAHIHRWLSTNKSRNVEIFSFLKQNSNLVLRDPHLFVEATVRKCKLTRYEPEGRMPQIALIDSEPPKPDGVSNTLLASLEPPSTQVMFYLIGEILSFKDQPEAPSSDESNDAGSLYQCLLLQCLAELFYCFPGCRLEFLSSSRNKASGVALPTRSRSLFINYLLNDILPYEAGDPRADPKADAKLITQSPDNKSARASNVIASLLIGSNNVYLETNYRELASMRLFVLDLIYRAFQEAMSLPSLTQRHSKVMSLCDLCFKVLTSKRPPGETAMRGEEDLTLTVAKGMLDKQFVPLFIGAINDLDMVYPTMKALINAIMRPLEVLSKLAIKLGHKPTEPTDRMDSDPNLDELSESPSEDEAAEDFLRSSALGVIDGTNAMLDEEDDEMDQGSEDLQDELGYSSEGSEDLSENESEEMQVQGSEYGSESDSTEPETEEDAQNEEQGSDWHSSEYEETQSIGLSPGEVDENMLAEEVPMLSEEEEAGLDEDDRDVDRELESVFENIYQDTLDMNSASLPWIQGDEDNPLAATRHILSGRTFHYGGSNSLLLPFSTSNDPLALFDTGFADIPGRRIAGLQDTATHPLLSNDRSAGSQPPIFRAFGDGHNHNALENVLGASASRPLSRLLSQFFRRLSPSGAHGNLFPTIIAEQNQGGGPIDITAMVNSANEGYRPSLGDLSLLSSNERWYQEAHMMFGVSFPAKAIRVLHAILNRLVPIAVEQQVATSVDVSADMEVEETLEENQDSEDSPKPEPEPEEMQEAQLPAEENTAAEEPPEAVPEQPRVTISIHGQEVDITNTGIDPTFLEALPDDLRQEVLNQHFQDNPPPTELPPDTAISMEFLNAIPAELRQEILFNERRLQEAQTTNDEDPEPEAEQGEGLSALGIFSGDHDPHDHAARSLSSHRRVALQLRLASSQRLLNPYQNGPRNQPANPESSVKTQALQLVDRSELATLLRLIFVPQATGKHLIHRILLNLCENYRTCSDLIALLLSIIQDGADDLASVDRSFANMSLRPKHKHQAKVFDQKVPNLITQRCLEALSFLLGANDHAIRFCLRELEGFSSRRSSKKSKKPASKYPLVVLLSMLDRPNFLQNPQLMDQAMQLLSAITKVLSSLVRHSSARSRPLEEMEESKPKTVGFKPPHIPDSCLDSIVNILASGECSNKTFQYTLSTIQHLLVLEGTEAAFTTEMIKRARSLGQDILESLTHIQQQLALDTNAEGVQSLILTAFSPSSSLQARLLRLLKTLDYMHTRKVASSTRDQETSTPSNPPRMYEELHNLELWNCLSNTLTLIQEHSSLIHVATVLLPLIEAFMVICKHSGFVYQPIARVGSGPEPPEAETSLFYQFTEGHRKLLNIIIRNNPSLMSGTFELLIKNHKVLDFDNKRNYFNQQLHKRNTSRDYHTTLQLNVRRQYVFEDSFRQFQGRSGQDIKYGKLNVKFHDEEGVDAGGVTREWFSVLSRQMFNPNYALFKSSANDKVTYQPNRTSWVNSDHLLYFKFVGRIIGKAIYDDHLFDAYFTRSFYKHILGKPVEIRDLEAIDPEFYKSMVWMLENDITDVVYANFCVETDDFGRKLVIELKPGGQDITVTQENKFEYVQLVTEQKLYGAIKDQIEHFLRGFHEVIPKELISIFNEQELELLISGLPDIDIDDWKNNTDYEGYTTSSPQIQWFWRAVRSFDQPERAKLLQFVTGTSKVPLEGFAHLQGSTGVQKFQIHRDFASVKRLPSAHTCFNQLDIPMYESYDDLRRQLLLAIEECNTGFGFG